MVVKAKGITKRRPDSAEQAKAKKEKAHIKSIQNLFARLSFERCATDGKQIEFKDRTGELDDIFIKDNVVVIAEYTMARSTSEHLAKKKILFDAINENNFEFIEYAKREFDEFNRKIPEQYTSDDLKIRFLYAAGNSTPNEEIVVTMPYLRPFSGSVEMYFKALTKTIEKSAAIEFYKFLNLAYEEVGEASIRAKRNNPSFHGYLLPDKFSCYPRGVKIVSFYADPASLINSSYVLRKDGWMDSAHLYQRILIPSKIKQMRKYLHDEDRVFINNIIVTLPSKTSFNHPNPEEFKNIPQEELCSVMPVEVVIPPAFDSIGIIDGQHRIFCYHESVGPEDNKISQLRGRQHLLVTGIIFPESMPEVERRNYEAKLFLEINDKQTRARAALKQDIEVIIRPCSSTAIAKAVLLELSKKGIYKNMLQTHYFDAPSKIKTSSIVTYGLKPLVKFSGDDSLYAAWTEPTKEELKKQKPDEPSVLLESYITYCADVLNDFLICVKKAYGFTNGEWDTESPSRSELLNPTVINGLINCLRLLIQNKKQLSLDEFTKNLVNVDEFDFKHYKSSQWRQLGEAFYRGHYGSF